MPASEDVVKQLEDGLKEAITGANAKNITPNIVLAGDFQLAPVDIKKTMIEKVLTFMASADIKEYRLEMVLDEQTSEFFLEQLLAMKSDAPVSSLSLSGLTLSHSSWEKFFNRITEISELIELNLKDSNFDYNHDFKSLESFVSANHSLEKINFCDISKTGDTTFKHGSKANALAQALKRNDNLRVFKFGGPLDDCIQSNLHIDIENKLKENTKTPLKKEKIREAVDALKDRHRISTFLEKSDGYIKDCIKDELKRGDPEKESTLDYDRFGMLMSIKSLKLQRAALETYLSLASNDKDFAQSKEFNFAQDVLIYTRSQIGLFETLEALYQQQKKASSHDSTIINNFREDFLKSLNKASEIENPTERKKVMSHTIQEGIEKCEQASSQVKDKTSGAIFKNILLVLGGILTAGLAIGIYAAVTKKSRYESGHFFFKNEQTSKEKLDDVKHNMETITHRPDSSG